MKFYFFVVLAVSVFQASSALAHKRQLEHEAHTREISARLESQNQSRIHFLGPIHLNTHLNQFFLQFNLAFESDEADQISALFEFADHFQIDLTQIGAVVNTNKVHFAQLAVIERKRNIVRLVKSRYPNLLSIPTESTGWNSLHSAVVSGAYEMIVLLRDIPELYNLNSQGYSPLHLAIIRRDTLAINLLKNTPLIDIFWNGLDCFEFARQHSTPQIASLFIPYLSL